MSQLIQAKSGDLVAQLAVRVPVEVRDWYKVHAATNGQSMNTAINAVLREKMEKSETEADLGDLQVNSAS